MRSAIRRTVNRLLRPAGVRLVSARWGPRGFGATLCKLKRAGFRPVQVVDVGASNGTWTRECMTIFPEAAYFLVDPLSENADALRRLAAERDNVTFWCGALGASEGTGNLNVHADQSSFLRSGEFSSGLNRTVPVRTLDSFVADGTILPASLLKADVQGFELEVLEGADRTMNTVEALLLELSFRRIYEECRLADEVISYLACRGFRIFDFCSYVQREADEALLQSDVVFVRREHPVFSKEGWIG